MYVKKRWKTGQKRLVGLVALAVCVVQGGEADKNRSIGGSMGVDTTVLASEVIGEEVNKGGVNSFLRGICYKCDSASEEDTEGKG